jgi:hypothetical protein
MKKRHSRNGLRAILLIAVVLGWPATGDAAKFTRAEVTKIVNEVQLLTGTKTSRPASIGATISGSTAVRTGQKSRSELQFPDESVVRLGSNSVFTFLQGKREVDLKQGTLLMQVPKSLGRTRVKTAAISAAITGTTILIEYVPPVYDNNGVMIKAGRIKIIVIEGSFEFALDISPRKTLKLVSGEMVAFSTDAKQLPQKFQIDLERLIKTSLLMDGGMGALPNLLLMDREVVAQGRDKSQGRLLASEVPRPLRNRLFSKLWPVIATNRARSVVNGRPPMVVPGNVQRVTRGGGPNNNNNGGPPPPNNPIPLPDRPDRPPPGGGPTN